MGRIPQRWNTLLIIFHQEANWKSEVTRNDNFHCLVKVVFTRFLQCKIILAFGSKLLNQVHPQMCVCVCVCVHACVQLLLKRISTSIKRDSCVRRSSLSYHLLIQSFIYTNIVLWLFVLYLGYSLILCCFFCCFTCFGH
jgi:hypothetical protein